MPGNITLILGGARSGKSTHAEHLALESRLPKLYLATAQALDTEMSTRIAAHRQRRGEEWATLEEPIAIADIIAHPAHEDSVILVDCLTLWLSNLMHQEQDIARHTQHLAKALQATEAIVVLVSNEVGQGIVPDNALARRFRDEAGILNQQMAAIADRVIWMIAGIPTLIKSN